MDKVSELKEFKKFHKIFAAAASLKNLTANNLTANKTLQLTMPVAVRLFAFRLQRLLGYLAFRFRWN